MRPSVCIDGEKVARLRKEAGLTQEEVKDALGFKSRQAIWKLEAGTRTTSPATLRRLAIILRVEPSELERKEPALV